MFKIPFSNSNSELELLLVRKLLSLLGDLEFQRSGGALVGV